MDLVDTLEALLFSAVAPASLNALAVALELTEGQIEQGLEILETRLSQKGAIQLVKIAGGYQLSTKPEFSDSIAKFLKPQRQRLSRSLMEVLAIIAYKQPITQAEVDQVRGVQSDYGVRQLLEKRLVQEAGRKQTAGRPFLYATTQQFLHQFNLVDLNQLPPLSTGLPVFEVQEGGLS
jgi:segregation and condensation protein B